VILGFVAALVEAVREQGSRGADGSWSPRWSDRIRGRDVAGAGFSSVTPIAMAPLAVATIAVAGRVGASFSGFTRALLAAFCALAFRRWA